MEHWNLDASKEALIAIKGIVGDALISEYPRPVVPRVAKLTRGDLSYDLKHIQHAELVHYLRCEAPKDTLLLIREATEDAVNLLDAGDNEIREELSLKEPFRRRLYTTVIIVALRVAEREAIRQEQEYWRRRNAMRLTPAYREAANG